MKWVIRTIFATLILVLCFAIAEIARSPKADDTARAYFFDVGQGDAVLIEKGSIQILIDGGPNDKILAELGRVMPLTDRNIEYVILTHPHADHLIGLNAVLDRYTVGKIYTSGVIHTSDSYLLFLQKIKDKKIGTEVPDIDESLAPFADGRLDFLWPGEEFLEKTIDNLNNSSIIGRFCYFSQCVFLPGDAEILEQNAMLDYYDQNKLDYSFKSQILKAAHHGSVNGANVRLYEKVLPSNTVIEVGADNKYGHPHQAALELAKDFKNNILRTDQDGTVEFIMGKEGTIVNNQ